MTHLILIQQLTPTRLQVLNVVTDLKHCCRTFNYDFMSAHDYPWNLESIRCFWHIIYVLRIWLLVAR